MISILSASRKNRTTVKKGDFMQGKINYDLTSYEGILESLSKYLNIEPTQIVNYISRRQIKFDLVEFLEDFCIGDEQLLSFELSLVSLHVTNNDDDCAAIKKYGLINLQEVVSSETTLGTYLRNEGIYIDIEKKEIDYQGKTYSISEGSKSDDSKLVYYKLYKDYQINSFLSRDNVLDYGVETMPEFLENLSDLLNSNDILDNWLKLNNKCYVVKFVAPLTDYANDNFYTQGVIRLNENDFEYLKSDSLELLKKKWILDLSFYLLKYFMTFGRVKELFGILNPKVTVPESNILKIYTPDEYCQEYSISQ